MYRLLFVLLLAFADPCYAGKQAKVMPSVTDALNFTDLCKQDHILEEYPRVALSEGRITPKEYTANMEKLEQKYKPTQVEAVQNYWDDCVMSFTTSHDVKPIRPQSLYSQSSEELNRALAVEFMSRKRAAMTSSLFLGLLPYTSDFFTMISTMFLTGGVGAGLAALKAATTVRDGVQTMVTEGNRIVNTDADPRLYFEVIYAMKKRFFPPNLQRAIEQRLSASYQSDQPLQTTLDNLEITVNLPTASKEPSSAYVKDIEEVTRGYIATDDLGLFKEYSFTQMITLVCAGHHANFTTSAGPSEHKRSIICFEGGPGLGKSYMSRQIAKALGVPAILVKFRSPQAFLGDETNPGDFLRAIAFAGSVQNAVIIIDDADQALNAGCTLVEKGGDSKKSKAAVSPAMTDWLSVLDPDCKTMYSPYLRTYIDISKYLFILTVNSTIQNAALRDRMNVFTIVGMEPGRKREIVLDSILPSILKSDILGLNLSMRDVDSVRVDSILAQYADSGFRKIEQALAYLVNTKRLGLVGNPSPVAQNLLVAKEVDSDSEKKKDKKDKKKEKEKSEKEKKDE